MARCVSVASGTAMSTDTVRPTIIARKRSAIVGARIGAVVIGVTTIVVVVVVVVVSAVVATLVGRSEGRHHLLHLSKQGSFASGHRSFTLLHGGIGDIWRGRRGRSIGSIRWDNNKGVEDTLSDEIDHALSGVGLMVHISCCGESSEILMSITKMGEHVGPGLVISRFARPDAHVMVEDGLFHEECIGQIQLVLGG